MSTIKVDQWLNTSGTENYKCRAWANITGVGTVAIRASGGISSVTDNGTGDITVNFSTAMPDANYGFAGIASRQVLGNDAMIVSPAVSAPTTTAFRFSTNTSTARENALYIGISFFR